MYVWPIQLTLIICVVVVVVSGLPSSPQDGTTAHQPLSINYSLSKSSLTLTSSLSSSLSSWPSSSFAMASNRFKLEFVRLIRKFGSILAQSSSDKVIPPEQSLDSEHSAIVNNNNGSTMINGLMFDAEGNNNRTNPFQLEPFLGDSYHGHNHSNGTNGHRLSNKSSLFVLSEAGNHPQSSKMMIRQPQSTIFPTIMMVICVFIVLLCCLANNGRSGIAGDYYYASPAPLGQATALSTWPTTATNNPNPPLAADNRHVFSRFSSPLPPIPSEVATANAPVRPNYPTSNNNNDNSQYYPSYYLISFSSVPIHEWTPLVTPSVQQHNQYHHEMSPPPPAIQPSNTASRPLLALTTGTTY